MTLIYSLLLAVLFVGIVAYGYWWDLHGGGRQRRETELRRKAERAARVGARGWQYEGANVGNVHYRISGRSPSGAAWRIHYDSDQSSSSPSPKLVFMVGALTCSRYVWTIHDRKTYDRTHKRSVRMIAGGVERLVGSLSEAMKTKRDFYVDAKALSVGSSTFRDRYVLAAIESRWSSLIDDEIERLILHWPEFKQSMSSRDTCISAELSPAGLYVHVYCDAPDMNVIEQLASLGQRLTDATTSIGVA